MVGKKPSPQIAKIAAPRVGRAVARGRLFRLLDRGCREPVIWISGPAGAGKTCLVSGYLEARQLPCLWYQIDLRDGDPATLFHYLTLASK